MNLEIVKNGSKVTIKVIGRLDTTNVQEFDKQANPTLDEKPMDLVIDCEALEYISSSGLRVFLTIQKKLTAYKGALLIINMRPEIKEVFDMTGFSKIFNIQ